MTCPTNLSQRALVLYTNGFGFQGPGFGVDNIFVIARVNNLTNEQINEIKRLTNVNSVELIDFIGRDFIGINWADYNKHKLILDAMLSLNISFTTHNKLEAYFEAGVDREYSQEIAERKAIARLNENARYGDLIIRLTNEVYLDPWNWKTEEGKRLCNQLRERLHKGPAVYGCEENYYNWSIFKNCDMNTLMTIEQDESTEEITDEDDDNTCLICMSNIPNTMVLPCEHCVVCKDCSIKLRATNDARICVKCRRYIDHILE